MKADDALELLLPGVDAATSKRAREVTQFLKLLWVDARRECARSVGLDLEDARRVLLEEGRATLERALADLVRHHIRATEPLDTFAWCGAPEATPGDCWREIEAGRHEFSALPELPRPGESAVEVGTRLVAGLAVIAPEPEYRLWSARWTQVVDGPRAAEKVYRELLAAARRPRPGPRIQRAAIAGVAECMLERGALREARAWLGEHALQVSINPRLRQLFAWTRLALGDVEGARTVLQGLRPWDGPLPRGLIELRDVRPEWLFALAGRTPAGVGGASRSNPGEWLPPTHPRADPEACAPERATGDLRERADCGASVLAVFAFAPGRGTELVAFDAAPALAHGRVAWLEEREGACAQAGEREQALVARAAVAIEHARADESLRGTLGGRATRALALAPILDEEGDVAGWIHLEFEHHLVPSRERLAGSSTHWRRAVLEVRRRVATEPARPTRAKPPDAYAAVFRALVDALGLKTIQRRWRGYSIEQGEPLLVAEGGEAQGFEDLRPGRARGLARALATGARIEFEEPDERLAVHARAASGLVLPLRAEGTTRGLLSIESSRRRDFQGVDLTAWSTRADAAAVPLGVAQFAAWHAARFGYEPWFEGQSPDFQEFARALVRAARSRAAATIVGAAGVGKLVVARWLHCESPRRDQPFLVQGAGSLATREDWSRLVARAAAGTLVLDDVEELAPALQEVLVRDLDGPRGLGGARDLGRARDREPSAGRELDPSEAPRLLVTTRGLDPRAGFRADLATRLGRLRIQVPPLAARRAEIPGLAQALARRFAVEESVAAPQFTDDACALLWRQPWPGNVRELENLVYKVVVERPGERLDAGLLARIAESSGASLVRRLPTRHPDERDLRAALRTTCTLGQRANKTRAALYLGWDPDTLVLRLRSAGLLSGVGADDAWSLGLEPCPGDPCPGASDTGEPGPAGEPRQE